MRATINFNLNDSDDAMAHFRFIKSFDMALAIFELTGIIRKAVDESEDGKHIDGWYLIERVNDVFDKHNIRIDELIQ